MRCTSSGSSHSSSRAASRHQIQLCIIIISSFFICPQARCLRFFLLRFPLSPLKFPQRIFGFYGKNQRFFVFNRILCGKVFLLIFKSLKDLWKMWKYKIICKSITKCKKPPLPAGKRRFFLDKLKITTEFTGKRRGGLGIRIEKNSRILFTVL